MRCFFCTYFQEKAHEQDQSQLEFRGSTAGGTGSCQAAYFQMQQNEPIDVGVDDSGICEYVIEFVIYYEEETAWEQ